MSVFLVQISPMRESHINFSISYSISKHGLLAVTVKNDTFHLKDLPYKNGAGWCLKFHDFFTLTSKASSVIHCYQEDLVTKRN